MPVLLSISHTFVWGNGDKIYWFVCVSGVTSFRVVIDSDFEQTVYFTLILNLAPVLQVLTTNI